MTLPNESPQQPPQENGQATEAERYQAVMNFDNTSGFDEFDLTKEFAEMKILWDRQNEEKLYAINEQALHEQIQRRGRSVDRTLQRYEWVMVGANLLTAIILTVSGYINNEETLLLYAIAVAYLVYGLFFLLLRRRRRRQDPAFAPTMVGDLDKALWQLNYLVDQTRSMTLWYSLPLTIVMAGFLLLRANWGWALAVLVVMGAASYFSIKWEVNRCYLPQIDSLQALRTKLVAP